MASGWPIDRKGRRHECAAFRMERGKGAEITIREMERRLDINETEANHRGLVDLLHRRGAKDAETLDQPTFVNRPDLVQQHHRVHGQATLRHFYQDARGALALNIRRDCGDDGHRTVPVADVVLQRRTARSMSEPRIVCAR